MFWVQRNGYLQKLTTGELLIFFFQNYQKMERKGLRQKEPRLETLMYSFFQRKIKFEDCQIILFKRNCSEIRVKVGRKM